MRTNLRNTLKRVILTCLLALFGGSAAQASDNLGLALLFGYNNFNNRPGVFNNYQLPYFSLHPPVYYGERYYRPYGASPFAAWPQLQPNPAYSPRLGADSANFGVVFENPHCQLPSSMPQQLSDISEGEIVQRFGEYKGPVVIDNPYFVDAESRYTSVANR
jgi:hypothetical protein